MPFFLLVMVAKRSLVGNQWVRPHDETSKTRESQIPSPGGICYKTCTWNGFGKFLGLSYHDFLLLAMMETLSHEGLSNVNQDYDFVEVKRCELQYKSHLNK